MDIETLTMMDVEADRIIADPSIADPSNGMEIYTKNLGKQLNEVYGATLTPDLLTQYGIEAGKWAIEHPAEAIYIFGMVGSALKKVYHDLVDGREPPTPLKFKFLIFDIEAGTETVKISQTWMQKVTETHKDRSKDER